MIPDIQKSPENVLEKVWFVDVVTEYGVGHHVPLHVTVERCAEILDAHYMGLVDRECPPSIGTEKWLRILDNLKDLDARCFAEFALQRRLYRAIIEFKNQVKLLLGLSIEIRSIISNIDNKENWIVIYLDSVNSLQMIAVWLSVASLVGARNRIIVWIHFHRAVGWLETRIGRVARRIFRILPITTWKTTFTSELAAEIRSKYRWDIDVLPLPLDPSMSALGCARKLNHESDRLICWLLITRPDQGVGLLHMMISHKSTNNFPKAFIKCFVSQLANVPKNDHIELISLPYGANDYYLRFDECDVVLLPYDSHLFGNGMSMKFIEAVTTFKVPIVSDGTVMARELRRFKLDDLILDFDNKFSWTLINEIRRSISIRERLNVMAGCYARKHGTFAYAEALYKNLKQQCRKTEPKQG